MTMTPIQAKMMSLTHHLAGDTKSRIPKVRRHIKRLWITSSTYIHATMCGLLFLYGLVVKANDHATSVDLYQYENRSHATPPGCLRASFYAV